MTPRELEGLADILPLPAAGGGVSWPAVAAFAVLAVLGVMALAWHWDRPLSRLRRRLRWGRLDPRQAAHELARHAGADPGLRARLDRLRFARRGPAAAEVMALLEEARRGG